MHDGGLSGGSWQRVVVASAPGSVVAFGVSVVVQTVFFVVATFLRAVSAVRLDKAMGAVQREVEKFGGPRAACHLLQVPALRGPHCSHQLARGGLQHLLAAMWQRNRGGPPAA